MWFQHLVVKCKLQHTVQTECCLLWMFTAVGTAYGAVCVVTATVTHSSSCCLLQDACWCVTVAWPAGVALVTAQQHQLFIRWLAFAGVCGGLMPVLQADMVHISCSSF